MPRGDGTGPRGQGPRTGRGLGYCAGYDSPGFTKGAPRGGAGFRRRPRRGFRPVRRRALPAREPTREDEVEVLREEKEVLKKEMESIEKRLEELEGEE
ncbi:MAG: DUF5320 domain-containing protein [Candidatus Aenigmatarchaeota archaeon]